MSRRFVVLDRDGTVIEDRHYLRDPDQVSLIPGAAFALRRFSEMNLGTVLLTNQSGVGRGLFDEDNVHLIHTRLRELLLREGVQLDGIYYCPHRPEDECSCRKPRPGLINQAAEEFGFDLGCCFVIGDKACDIELGRGVGATTILVLTGYGAQFAADSTLEPDYVVEDLGAAARIVEQALDDPAPRERKRG